MDNKYIAYCGLDCSKCEAYIATQHDDNELRKKVAEEWSKLNGVEITPEMINCDGCRLDGRKTPFCDSICEIKKCASSNSYCNCGACGEVNTCNKVSMIIGNNEEARKNIIK